MSRISRWQVKRKVKRMLAKELSLRRFEAGEYKIDPALVEVWAWAKACESLAQDFARAFDDLAELARIQQLAEESRIKVLP